MRHAVGFLLVSSFSLAFAAPPAQRTLSFEKRVEAQRAIEQVYWSHRVWPKENPHAKPPLSAVMSDDAIRAKVQDYLEKSSALGSSWQRPIDGEQLQAELNRMARDSRDPKLLGELFAALGNDPLVIAETMARPALADRLIPSCCASDARLRSIDARPARMATADASFVLPEIVAATCATDTWLPTAVASAPSGRANFARVWTGAELIVWGGQTPNYTNSGGRYNPATDVWTPTSMGANVPTPRTEATGVWTGTEMIVWGGFAFNGTITTGTDTGARYNPTTDTWVTVPPGGGARGRHTAVWTGTEMIVWGGYNGSGSDLNSGARYKPAIETWTATASVGLVAREAQTAIWSGTEMIVWGGWVYSAGGGTNTGGRYDPTNDSWSLTSTGLNVPTPRSGHTAVWTGSEMVVWGGGQPGFPNGLNTGGRYSPATNSWTPTSTGANVPAPRSGHSSVWNGADMIVWGGRGSADFNYGGRYAPSTDAWAEIPTDVNIPYPRSGQAAVWAGEAMVLWGGYGGGYLNTGGRYCAPCASPRSGYRDLDGDGYGDPNGATTTCGGTLPAGYVENAGDCDDTTAAVHPGAPEVNDGLDDQCPGDAGFGIVDELSAMTSFETNTQLTWPAQTGAASYDVVRSTNADFSADCSSLVTNDAWIADSSLPAPGSAFFYLVRPSAPHVGSWGARSDGSSRAGACLQ